MNWKAFIYGLQLLSKKSLNVHGCFDAVLLLFSVHHCLHGSWRQVVIGDVYIFKGKGVIFWPRKHTPMNTELGTFEYLVNMSGHTKFFENLHGKRGLLSWVKTLLAGLSTFSLVPTLLPENFDWFSRLLARLGLLSYRLSTCKNLSDIISGSRLHSANIQFWRGRNRDLPL